METGFRLKVLYWLHMVDLVDTCKNVPKCFGRIVKELEKYDYQFVSEVLEKVYGQWVQCTFYI